MQDASDDVRDASQDASSHRRMAERQRKKRAAASSAYSAVLNSRNLPKGARGRIKARQCMDWGLRRENLGEKEFIQRYRMDKKTFAGTVCRLIYDHPSLSPDCRRSTCGSGGDSPATVETMLSATLRYCAGGAWQDIVDTHHWHRKIYFSSLCQEGHVPISHSCCRFLIVAFGRSQRQCFIHFRWSLTSATLK